jgi:hypothetical protein
MTLCGKSNHLGCSYSYRQLWWHCSNCRFLLRVLLSQLELRLLLIELRMPLNTFSNSFTVTINDSQLLLDFLLISLLLILLVFVVKQSLGLRLLLLTTVLVVVLHKLRVLLLVLLSQLRDYNYYL